MATSKTTVYLEKFVEIKLDRKSSLIESTCSGFLQLKDIVHAVEYIIELSKRHNIIYFIADLSNTKLLSKEVQLFLGSLIKEMNQLPCQLKIGLIPSKSIIAAATLKSVLKKVNTHNVVIYSLNDFEEGYRTILGHPVRQY